MFRRLTGFIQATARQALALRASQLMAIVGVNPAVIPKMGLIRIADALEASIVIVLSVASSTTIMQLLTQIGRFMKNVIAAVVSVIVPP